MLKDLSVPLLTAIVSGVIAVIVARYQASKTADGAIRSRQRDLSIEVTKLLLDDATSAAAARRFAVAILKIVQHAQGHDVGRVLFVPINSRVTVGRDPSNDMALADMAVSRHHFGLVSEGKAVFVENFSALNGIEVNGAALAAGESRVLARGDQISFADYVLRFNPVHCSNVLFL